MQLWIVDLKSTRTNHFISKCIQTIIAYNQPKSKLVMGTQKLYSLLSLT